MKGHEREKLPKNRGTRRCNYLDSGLRLRSGQNDGVKEQRQVQRVFGGALRKSISPGAKARILSEFQSAGPEPGTPSQTKVTFGGAEVRLEGRRGADRWI